ncbi:MAG: hypothetical protein DRH70_08640 [Candidatus Coatesbacteria bacterium]|nr:MAG: hypothetical protein DRH70_08640 [Candidatus Coatesbacteria bacterium]
MSDDSVSPKANPGYIKLDLFCRGMRIDPSCDIQHDGRPILRTRAGLGSGLDMILPGNVWVNAPVEEDFAKSSPYCLHKEDGEYVLRHDGECVAEVTLPARPTFYGASTTSGKLMSQVGVMQGTYLGIYPTRLCYHWTLKPRQNCKFCSVGLNLGQKEAMHKTVEDVVETVLAARRECRITFVHFNTGYQEGDTYLDDLEPFIKAVKKRTGLLIGVQTPPHPDLSRYSKLRKMGVNNVSFCFELMDEGRLREVCPGKSRFVGLKRYLDAIEHCASMFDTTNGEIIAGLEPVEKTLEAIDWITGVGAIPTVCVFRPLKGTDYESVPPPKTEEVAPIFARLYQRCMEHNLPIGIAPNIKVSMVLLPEEGRYFLDNPRPYGLKRVRLWAMSKAFGIYFRTKLKVK